MEALVPSFKTTNPFREARAFRHDPSSFCSYGLAEECAGKSIGVLAQRNLQPHGPHHFRAAASSVPMPKEETLVLSCDHAVILHYESTSYTRWLDKFGDYADRMRLEGAGAINKALGFSRFYRLSISHCAQLREARAAESRNAVGLASGLLSHLGATDIEAGARTFWTDEKVEPPGLPASANQITVLTSQGLTLIPPPAAWLPPLEPALDASPAGMHSSLTMLQPPLTARSKPSEAQTDMCFAFIPSSVRPHRAYA